MLRILRWGWRGTDMGPRTNVLTVADYLHQVDVLKDLSREDIDELFKGVELREYPPGTLLFTPEDSAEQVFILKEGEIDVYRLTKNGKRLVTRRIGPGTVFGEMGLLGQTLQGCFAEARAHSLVCVAGKKEILRLLSQRPDVALRLLEVLGQRVTLLEERLEHAAYSPVRTRLAQFLLESADGATGAVTGYSHEGIGENIGALRQTVTEVLNEMESKGLIKLGHKNVQIVNRTGVKEILSDG